MKNDQLLNQLAAYLERLGYSESTVQMIKRCSQEFVERMAVSQIYYLQDVSSSDIIDHYTYLTNRPNQMQGGGLSSHYIGQQMYSLRVFFEWLQIRRIIAVHPMSTLDFPKGKSQPMEVLSSSEIEQLYEVCISWKEKTLLSIYYGCGLRRKEGERLNLRDVHFGSGILYVRHGKGNKRRAIPMSEKVAHPIYQYIQEERINPYQSKALILNNSGTRMKGATWSQLLKTLLSRTTIDKKISLHCLRHSIATHLLSSGMNVEKVQEFLGHKHLESTTRYTRVSQSMIDDIT